MLLIDCKFADSYDTGTTLIPAHFCKVVESFIASSIALHLLLRCAGKTVSSSWQTKFLTFDFAQVQDGSDSQPCQHNDESILAKMTKTNNREDSRVLLYYLAYFDKEGCEARYPHLTPPACHTT
eukprot:2502448-Amphidinium_carterae.1